MTDATARLSAALADRYLVERQLGAGGMATVYLAQDVRHDRKVALKVLRPELAAVIGADRFLAEIKTTAQLQHAHILGLIDSGEVNGTVFYAMPFVDGESLRDRIDREKQLPVADAVRIATAVAGALDYAHRRGVIHRDIKPANILLHEGQPFVADFGIALAAFRTGTNNGSRMTETGMSLGTPQYMSPEQAMGERNLDARTDIYSLGCVLYEMLTGEPPFTGPTAQAIVAKVMGVDPEPVTTLRRSVPPNVAAAAMTALSKVPADRFATAADFADALQNPQYRSLVAGAAHADTARRFGARGVAAIAAITILAIVAVAGWMRTPSTTEPAPVARFEVALPSSAAGTPVMLSPDGSRILWASADGLWERRLDSLTVRRLREPALAQGGIRGISPDGRQVLVAGRGSAVIAPLTSGPASPLTVGGRGSWGADGQIYYAFGGPPGTPHGIARSDAAGGRMDTVVTMREGEFPFDIIALPDGKALVAVLNQTAGITLSALDIGSKTWHPLGVSGSAVQYVAPGYLLFSTGQYLMAAPFDRKKLALTQPAVPIAEAPGGSIERFTVGGNVLAYIPGADPLGVPGIVERARAGAPRLLPNVPDSIIFSQFTMSPDGERVAAVGTPRPAPGANLSAASLTNIYVFELASGRVTRWRSDVRESQPSWMPGGRELSFIRVSADSPSTAALMHRPWDASGPAVSIYSQPAQPGGRSPFGAASWLPDGRHAVLAVVRTQPAGGRGGRGGGGGPQGQPSELMMLSLDAPGSLKPVTVSDFSEGTPAVSPNGKLLAYRSNESGRTEIYVRPLAGGAYRQVSVNGGDQPKWARTRSELFYRNGDTLYTARVDAGAGLTVDRVSTLLTGGNLVSGYAVGPGDSLFIMRAAPTGEPPKTVPVIVVLNIAAELDRIFRGLAPPSP